MRNLPANPLPAPKALAGDGDDVLDGQNYTPAEVGALSLFRKPDGSPTSRKSVYRWLSPAGCRGVVLGSVITPGGVRIPRREVVIFIDRLGKANNPGRATITSTAKRRAQTVVDRELDAMGIR